MRNNNIDVSTVELLPIRESPNTSQARSSNVGDERIEAADDALLPSYKRNLKIDAPLHENPPPGKQWPHWMLFQQAAELVFFLAVLATAIPIILLLRYAPTLSARLGSQACLPNGEFMLPGTASIWDPAYFFTISITLQGAYGDWTYTHVKILDVVWDVTVGRGGQVLLIYIAYRVFSRSLTYVMETKAVSYQTYSAVSFDSTSLRSIWQYLRNIGWKRSNQNWRSWRTFIAMTLASLYVVSIPTMFSTMTGYAALFAPSLEIPPAGNQGEYVCADLGGCSIFPCGGGDADPAGGYGLAPGWGVVIDSTRVEYASPWTITVADAYGITSKGDSYYLREYYERYRTEYNALATDTACRNVSSLADCPATNIESVYSTIPGGYINNLEAPLLNIQLWGSGARSGVPDVWLCNGLIINTYDFNGGNITGICNAATNAFTGTSYQWGFSFLLLLIVCSLNLVFAAIMYGLWVEARRNSSTPMRREKKVDRASGVVQWRTVDYPSTLNSVMQIAAQVRSDHGDEVFDWPSRKLNKEVWRGKEGIRARKRVADGDGDGAEDK